MAVRSLRWVSDYRTDRVDSIKLFSSVRQNMISWHFRPLRWVSDYRTDKVDSINFFLHIVKIACRAWGGGGKIASLGVGLSYGQGRLHKTFFFRSPKYDFLAFQTASLGVGLSYFVSPKYDLCAFQTISRITSFFALRQWWTWTSGLASFQVHASQSCRHQNDDQLISGITWDIWEIPKAFTLADKWAVRAALDAPPPKIDLQSCCHSKFITKPPACSIFIPTALEGGHVVLINIHEIRSPKCTTW